MADGDPRLTCFLSALLPPIRSISARRGFGMPCRAAQKELKAVPLAAVSASGGRLEPADPERAGSSAGAYGPRRLEGAPFFSESGGAHRSDLVSCRPACHHA